jgi:hypothetical protein
MKDDILTYREMCDAEGVQTLQRGMNYRLNADYSVILMSQRPNAPYKDEIQSDGITIAYEGHDAPRSAGSPEPKLIDQPRFAKSGAQTQNGKFADAVERFKVGSQPEKVRVYDKLFDGVWSFKGLFDLIDYSYDRDLGRRAFKFILQLSDETEIAVGTGLRERSRIIPTNIKKQVRERDRGRCVICGAKDELHFDHDIPYSKGGTSVSVENVRILCARHNLSKRDKIE